jgi:asparagine synthase (glutamine-hydrolysing)
LGVKPLLRTITESGTLLFASEAKAFRAHPEYTPMLDEAALVARLAFEYSLDDTTLFAGVAQVRPGTVETWRFDDAGRATLTGVARYHTDVVQPASRWDAATNASSLLASLTSSLADRLMSDVPVGIVLSGGLDSSLVAALAHQAAEIAGKPLPECWTVAESEDNPDWLAAEEVASTLEIPHHQYILPADSFPKALPDLSWFGEDLDLTVLFFQPLFARMAEDVSVGLCGQGADELHGGYPRYQNLAEHSNLIRSRLESVDHPTAQALLTGTEVGPSGAGQPWTDSSHIPDQVFEDLQTTLQYELDHGQLTNFQLRLVDRHSMAHGLEVRVPFLGSSHRVASHRLPINLRVDQPREKIALRAAADLTSLPKSIVMRPKMPAGRATSPTMIDDLLNELAGHASEYANDLSALSPLLKSQPDISIGLRLFRSLHLVDGGVGRYGKDLMTLLEDVD